MTTSPLPAPPFTATPARIVVPVDFGTTSEMAARAGAALLRHVPSSRLHLLHVDSTGVGEHAVKEQLVRLAAEAGIAGSRAPTVKLAQRTGPDAAEVVAAYAAEIHADLIVASRPAVSGWRRLALGRTADALVRAAHTPVLVLPASSMPPHAPRRIVVGVALGEHDGAFLDAVTAFAVRYGGDGVRLTFVHAIPPLPYPAVVAGGFLPVDPELRALVEKQAHDLATAHRRPGLDVEVRVEDGPIAATLLAIADEVRADLVAVAPATHSRVERWVLGSVAERVVRTATRPVLVVRPPAEA